MNSIFVSLKPRSYAIRFGSFESGVPAAIKKLRLRPSTVLILTTQAVYNAGYPDRLAVRLRKGGFKTQMLSIPNGESNKSLKTLNSLYPKALKLGCDRKTLVVAMGGGVITDLAGFFAATFLRGLPYISIPTTLLAMVDASVGGKTGVDLPDGKNLVGAFWQPHLVWVDQKLLKTLPSHEWKTGFAEIIKYGVIKSSPFFNWLEKKLKSNADVVTWKQKDLHKAIYESIRMKAHVVSRDERETPLKGGREILNFGHTIGHALEAATVYGKLTHGQAISIGMIAAGYLALSQRMWDFDSQLRLLFMLQVVGLPVRSPKLKNKEKGLFWSSLTKDKKQIGGRLRFVLPKKIGRVSVKSGIKKSAVNKALSKIGF